MNPITQTTSKSGRFGERLKLRGKATLCLAGAGLAGATLVATALGGPVSAAARPASHSSPASERAAASGTANVAYAASLIYLNEKVVGPAFTKATGFGYSGTAGPSLGLSKSILAGEITPNAFTSVGATPIQGLEPKFTRWYVRYASSPIVVAYNPHGKYGAELKAIAERKKPLRDLFQLMATPGFRLGRTDPNIDPQGQAFVEMLLLAKTQLHLSSATIAKILGGPPGSANDPGIYAEASLEATLQAGQLDAASAYYAQAVQLHLPYIQLPSTINFGNPNATAHYKTATFALDNGMIVTGKPLVLDITTIHENGAAPADVAAGNAFVAYVLSHKGLALYKAGGYTLLHPTLFGPASAVPAAVRKELHVH
jgi:molybdate/tungstate transport system substrate-binding protein